MQDWMSKLERAKALLEAGALTPEEFEAEKIRLLPRTSSPSSEGELREQDDSEWEVIPVPGRSPTQVVLGILLALAAVSAGYYYLRTDASTPTPALASAQPSNPVAAPAPVANVAPKEADQTVPEPKQHFECVGAYSAVSFSEESGDGSGLFVRIGQDGDVKWQYFEGGVLDGDVTVETRSSKRMTAVVRYPSFPDDTPSLAEFTCADGQLSVESPNIGESKLRKLSDDEVKSFESY